MALSVPAHHFTEKKRASVTQLRHEIAELVPGIGKRDGFSVGWWRVSGKDLGCMRRDCRCIETEFSCKLAIEGDDIWRADRGCVGRREEPFR